MPFEISYFPEIKSAVAEVCLLFDMVMLRFENKEREKKEDRKETLK